MPQMAPIWWFSLFYSQWNPTPTCFISNDEAIGLFQ